VCCRFGVRDWQLDVMGRQLAATCSSLETTSMAPRAYIEGVLVERLLIQPLQPFSRSTKAYVTDAQHFAGGQKIR
jgi:hypothetical protein